MRTLLACELRKILSRKVLWVVLTLGVVMWVQVRGTGIVRERLSGSTQGVKDVIAQYEGQVLTEALQARMQKDYEGYAAAHAGRFEWRTMLEGEPEEFTELCPTEEATGYDRGVGSGFAELTARWSLEDQQQRLRQLEQILVSGEEESGKPLTAEQRRNIRQSMRYYTVTPVVHYAKGWEEVFQAPNECGQWVLLATVVALLALFGGEASARMEPIVLTARARQRAVAAKLLAGAIVAGGSAVLFFGLQYGALAYAWGLRGGLLPASAIEVWYGDMPVLAVFLLSALALVLDAMACGAIVAWASARFRHMLLALLAAGAMLAAMIVLQHDGLNVVGHLRAAYPHSVLLLDAVRSFVYALPANTLLDTYMLPDGIGQTARLLVHLVLPAALAVLLSWFARRAFLRRRRA